MKRFMVLIKYILVLFMLLLSFSLVWCIEHFGNISLDEIIFTLNMPLKEAADSYFISYFFSAVCPTIAFAVILLLAKLYTKKRVYALNLLWKSKKGIRTIRLNGVAWFLVMLIWIGEIISISDENFALYSFVEGQLQASELIENEYIDASEVNIKFPEEKKNMICIYMESAETSFMDKANGGLLEDNIIPEMTQMAEENISFSHSELLEGAAVAPACGWTIAGLVAQTSGMPLKLYKYEAPDNAMGKYVSFLPGVTSMGEILEKEGYKNFFMAGSGFGFAGRQDYFTQHGNYEIWDYNTAKELGKIPEDYKVWWGFEDAKLYEFAKEKLIELAAGGQPFNFSMITVDTHNGGGYVCELCTNTYDSQYMDVWACGSRQVYDFVNWIKQQDFYDNTVICITGDHSSMEPGFLEEYEYEAHEGNTVRKVYNVIINSKVEPVHMKNRKFTTLDMFPTVLASIGVEIEGERLGLGTNLFSDVPTLAEKYGYDELFTELRKKSRFYDNNILYPKN